MARNRMGPIDLWRWGHYIPLKYQEPITQWHSPYPRWNRMLLQSRLFIFRLLYLNISVSAIFDLSKKHWLTEVVVVVFHHIFSVILTFLVTLPNITCEVSTVGPLCFIIFITFYFSHTCYRLLILSGIQWNATLWSSWGCSQMLWITITVCVSLQSILHLHGFRLLPQCKWTLCSSGILHSK